MSDREEFVGIPIIGLDTPEQQLNRMEERISDFERHLGEWPGPYDPLNGEKYVLWERRAMLWLGRVSERLACLQEMRMIAPGAGQKLKVRALGVIARATERVQMGSRS